MVAETTGLVKTKPKTNTDGTISDQPITALPNWPLKLAEATDSCTNCQNRAPDLAQRLPRQSPWAIKNTHTVAAATRANKATEVTKDLVSPTTNARPRRAEIAPMASPSKATKMVTKIRPNGLWLAVFSKVSFDIGYCQTLPLMKRFSKEENRFYQRKSPFR